MPKKEHRPETGRRKNISGKHGGQRTGAGAKPGSTGQGRPRTVMTTGARVPDSAAAVNVTVRLSVEDIARLQMTAAGGDRIVPAGSTLSAAIRSIISSYYSNLRNT